MCFYNERDDLSPAKRICLACQVSWPTLKGEFIVCGRVLSHLWRGHGCAYANLCPPSLHIKQLILPLGECD